FRADSSAPHVAKTRQPEGMCIKFLATVPVESIAAEEILVGVLTGIDVFRNEETAWCAARLAPRRLELRKKAARAFQREVIHQVVAQLSGRVAEAVRKPRGRGIEQDPRGFQRACRQYHDFSSRFAMSARCSLDIVHTFCFAF